MRTTIVVPIKRPLTAATLIVSRMMDTSKGSVTPSRTTVMIISDPIGPRIRSTAWSIVSPLTDLPSTLMIKSPEVIPALSAGVPSMGETTLT